MELIGHLQDGCNIIHAICMSGIAFYRNFIEFYRNTCGRIMWSCEFEGRESFNALHRQTADQVSLSSTRNDRDHFKVIRKNLSLYFRQNAIKMFFYVYLSQQLQLLSVVSVSLLSTGVAGSTGVGG